MHLETVGDVVKWSGDFHQSLARFLPESTAGSNSERTKMLSDYIAGHEETLAKTVHALSHTESKQALGTWVTEFMNEQPLPNTDHGDNRWQRLTAEELLDEVLEIHGQLIDLYKFLHGRCNTTPAGATLAQLVEIEEHELGLITHSANRLQDL